MLGLFKQAKQEPSLTEKTKQIRESMETLSKRQAYLESQVKEDNVAALKANDSKNKRLAMSILKRRRGREAQIQTLLTAQSNLETVLMEIEKGATNLIAYESIATGASVLKTYNSKIDIERAEALQDDLHEQFDKAKEIDMVLGMELGDPIDESEFEADLAQLIAERDAENAATAPELDLPNVPSNVPSQPEKQKPMSTFDKLSLEMEM